MNVDCMNSHNNYFCFLPLWVLNCVRKSMMIKLDLKMHKMLGARSQWMNEQWTHLSLILCFILNTQMLLLHYTSLCTLCNDFSISVTSLSEKKTASKSSIIFFLNLLLPDDCSGKDICFCKIVEIFLKWKANADDICVSLTFTWVSLYLFLLVHLLDEILLCLGTIWSLGGDFLCKFHTSAFVESHFS